MCAPSAYASEDLQGAYQIDVSCAAAAAAARMEVSATADQDQRGKADQIARWTLLIAETSGHRLGLQADAVGQTVADTRENLLRHLQQSDSAKAASERADLGRTVIDCALLHAIKTTGHDPGRQPHR